MRFDGGLVAQTPIAKRYVLKARLSATRRDEDHQLGDLFERNLQDTLFTEIAVRGTATRQTWVGGVAFERSTLDPLDQPQFGYVFNVPGVFVQDDVEVVRWSKPSLDLTRSQGPLTVTGTVFVYDVRDPAVVNRSTYTLSTLPSPTINAGVETVATFRRAPFNVTATYTYVHSREGIGPDRGDIPLTPRHSAGLVGTWEREERGRIGVEAYFTGAQRLEDNPYRSGSVGYVLFGALVEHRFGRIRARHTKSHQRTVHQRCPATTMCIGVPP
jgi:TonB-dependent receptor-like protein